MIEVGVTLLQFREVPKCGEGFSDLAIAAYRVANLVPEIRFVPIKFLDRNFVTEIVKIAVWNRSSPCVPICNPDCMNCSPGFAPFRLPTYCSLDWRLY